MNRLASFETDDTARLFQLAKKLHEKNFFKEVLSNFQYQVLSRVLALDNFELWRAFLEGNCVLKIDSSEESRNPNTEEESETLDEGAKPLRTLALNLRFLLWEKAIDYYYSNESAHSSHSKMRIVDNVSEDYDLLESLDTLPADKAEASKQEAVKESAAMLRDEDDDYDVDDDDDGDEGENSQNIIAHDKAKHGNGDDTTLSSPSLCVTDDGQTVLSLPRSAFSIKTTENPSTDSFQQQMSSDEIAPVASTLEERDSQIKRFNRIYHIFEYDRETLLKRRKLEKSDMQLENSKSNDGGSNDIPISFGSASHSLKHLLNTIKDRRDDVGLSDLELRSLFMDIRKHRGKWANDDRVGQEELYEACEKVLLDLRGYTEHSTPFLNKVSKREAPNYGLIIKKPMDLNTVMKKLKSLSYSSKAEFVDDLMLIWNNCLLYNADPKHYLRAHAIAMQKRTQKLAPSIPDIVIKNRSEIEKEEEVENEGTATPSKKGGKTSKKGSMRRREEVIKSEELESGGPDLVKVEPSSIEGTPAPSTPQVASAALVQSNGHSVQPEENPEDEEEDADDVENDVAQEDNDDIQDVELQAWKVFTAKSRANYCSARAALFDHNFKLKMDADAIIRESKKMNDFDHFLDNKEVISKGNKLLDNDEPYLLEYDIAGGVPELEYMGVDTATHEQYEKERADAILEEGKEAASNSGLYISPDSGLNSIYTKNITEIQEIRKICFKISLIRQMQTQQFVHRSQMRQPEIEYLKEMDIDPVSKMPNHELNSGVVQYAALRKSIAKIGMHTGFETTEPFALNTLTQVAERYMSNLARSMKMHCESTSRNVLTAKEVVLVSLLENGVEKPDDLYTFVHEKLQKNETKLTDLRNKLSGFLKDLLRPSLESFSEQNFDDDSEQFTTGDFTNELGDDFFGFKELGLDKEFKMLSSSVPVHLLHSKLHSSFNNAGAINKTTKYEDLTGWQTVKLTVADVNKQIGLLQAFYHDLAQKSEVAFAKQQKKKGEVGALPSASELYLLEDEELPQKQRNIRPRLPPTGKIQSVKKKPLSNAYILPEEEEEESLSMKFGAGLDEIKSYA